MTVTVRSLRCSYTHAFSKKLSITSSLAFEGYYDRGNLQCGLSMKYHNVELGYAQSRSNDISVYGKARHLLFGGVKLSRFRIMYSLKYYGESSLSLDIKLRTGTFPVNSSEYETYHELNKLNPLSSSHEISIRYLIR